jgi:hypothetical protein
MQQQRQEVQELLLAVAQIDQDSVQALSMQAHEALTHGIQLLSADSFLEADALRFGHESFYRMMALMRFSLDRPMI